MKIKQTLKIKEKVGRIITSKIYKNKCTGQYTIVLPKKKMKGFVPKVVEVTW